SLQLLPGKLSGRRRDVRGPGNTLRFWSARNFALRCADAGVDISQRHNLQSFTELRYHWNQRWLFASIWDFLLGCAVRTRRTESLSFPRRRVMRALAASIAFSGALAWCGSPIRRAPAATASVSNPMDASERAQRAGAKLYARECAACHGQNREGWGK